MDILFVIAGAILVIISIVSFVSKKSKEKQLFTIDATESATVEELNRLAEEISKDKFLDGKGYFNKDVKITGVIGTDKPLISEFARVECVWYSSKVVRQYEVEVQEKDDEGNITTRIENKEEVVSDRSNKTEFWINDGTGKIFVSMEGLNFDDDEAFDRFVPYHDVQKNGYKIKIGAFELTLSEDSGGKSNTIGYRYIERVLKTGKTVLITGDARDVDGKLKFYEPKEDYLQFMLRFGTETEIKNALKKTISTLNKVIPITGVLGLASLGSGIILLIF